MKTRARRRLNFTFQDSYFKPRGIPLRDLEEVIITDEELEALRLRFIEKLNQTQASSKMQISQSQYQRDLVNVMEKITRAFIENKAIKILAQDHTKLS